MNDVLSVLSQNILPIFVAAGIGVALRRWTDIDKQALSRLAFYALGPCLVFSSLVESRLTGGEVARLTGFALAAVAAMGGLSLLVSRLLSFSRQEQAALALVVMFTNSGNFGLTLNQLRYGDAGLSRAVVYFTVSTVLVFTLGIFVASLGQMDWRTALRRVLQMPAFYAVILALIVYGFHIPLPSFVARGIEIAGEGSIPVMLIVLGMQLADLRSVGDARLAVPAVALRLLVAPLVALGLAALIGLRGTGYAVSILQASLPTAVITTILATEFDVNPSGVTTVVLLTTLLSPITLTLAITLLRL
ncbi:MAG: AEC family transporter [Candidatus Promineifilaceae bacterium]